MVVLFLLRVVPYPLCHFRSILVVVGRSGSGANKRCLFPLHFDPGTLGHILAHNLGCCCNHHSRNRLARIDLVSGEGIVVVLGCNPVEDRVDQDAVLLSHYMAVEAAGIGFDRTPFWSLLYFPQ